MNHQHRPQPDEQELAAPATAQSHDGSDLEARLSTLVHWRLLTKNVDNLHALMRELRVPRPDLARRIFDRGDRVESALVPPDPDSGLHGTYDGERLAAELFGEVNALIDFEMRYGQTPTIIGMQAEQIAALGEMRSLIRTEVRLLLQAEVRTVLSEEVRGLLHELPTSSPTQEAREEAPQAPQECSQQ